MGYNQKTVTQTIENYIYLVTIRRDDASIIVVEGEGPLTDAGVVNDAGQRYHIPAKTTQYAFSIADCISAGIDITELTQIDDKLRGYAELLVQSAKPQAVASIPEPVPEG
jgi:hypothetical protein